jgi:phosphoglycolate phosphatase-like HAD superfamily hydrolase
VPYETLQLYSGLDGDETLKIIAPSLTGEERKRRSLLGVDDLIDHVACGEDVEKGKPDPGLVRLAVEKLRLPAARCVMIGDTPYDAEAAVAVEAAAIGLLSGGFAREALLEAGVTEVRGQVGELNALFGKNETAMR